MDSKKLERFLNWVSKASPELYAVLKVKNPDAFDILKTPGLSYIGAIDIDWGKVVNNISDTISKVLPIYQQQQIFKMQLSLAKDGKPMIDPQSIALPSVPIQVDMPPEVKQQISKSTNMLLLGGLGLAAFFLAGKKKRR